MQPQDHPRYEILETIAQGDFATVMKARDLQLGREVAVKQIHQQYLNDPEQLERYWQEAQLLASLEHPYIMTIYDVVRERGWLILELMQGSLQQKLAGAPIVIDDLRLTLIYTLSALQFLHENGIVHGDVKPGNLLLDKNNRVKLGDFGIARRLSSDEGSVTKGTTKYMAPEVFSPELGDTGPHSDIYSLGFTAYELMCGSNFDQLFPALNMYGRDKQVAWMMWHASSDQRLPQIARVLEGVPPDMAGVIEKMIEKNPQQRYRSAEKVALELKAGVNEDIDTRTADEIEAEQETQKKEKKKKWLVYAAFAGSLLLCLAILFVPTGPGKPPAPPAVSKPATGVLTDIALDKNMLWITPPGETKAESFTYSPDDDRVMLNGAIVPFSDLRIDDTLSIKRFKSEDGSQIQEFAASRPVAKTDSGEVASIDLTKGFITLLTGSANSDNLKVYVPTTARLTMNGEPRFNNKRFSLGDLRTGDRATVEHGAGSHGREAIALAAKRNVSFKGKVVSVNTDTRQLKARRGRTETAPVVSLPLATSCLVTLNGKQVVNGKELTLGDLSPGDNVLVSHDTHISSIAADRDLTASGEVTAVNVEAKTLQIKMKDYPAPVEFTLAQDVEIDFLESEETATLAQIRAGDTVQITHLSPELRNPVANTIAISPTPDRRTWAVVIGQQRYAMAQIPAVSYAVANIESIRDALQSHYRVAPDQLYFAADSTQLKVQADLPEFLKKIPAGSQLVVYFVGHSYIPEDGDGVLAFQAFNAKAMETTGLPLKWLVSQMELTPADEKLLLLDTAHQPVGRYQSFEPSAEGLVKTILSRPGKAASTSVFIIGSTSKGEKDFTAAGGQKSAFGAAVAAGFEGGADADGDYRITGNELVDFIAGRFSAAGAATNKTQTLALFRPDATPDRLSPEYIKKIKEMLTAIKVRRNSKELEEVYLSGRSAFSGQPDMDIAYGLALHAGNKTSASLEKFESAHASHPQRLTPIVLLAWQKFMRKEVEEGVAMLLEAVEKLKIPEDGMPGAFASHVLELTGEMAMFAYKAADPPVLAKDLSKVTKAVQAKGAAADAIYRRGVKNVTDEIEKIDQQIALETDNARLANLQRDRRRLTRYTRLNYDIFQQYVEEQLTQ